MNMICSSETRTGIKLPLNPPADLYIVLLSCGQLTDASNCAVNCIIHTILSVQSWWWWWWWWWYAM